jgi:hypothetical protein
MSRKRLDKTVIEGGRTNPWKFDRKESLQKERINTKLALRTCDDYEELSLPSRQRTDLWLDEKFADKLSPLRRWLSAQVGRPWDKIYSEIKKKFDIRTTPGRHIVYDHLLHSVALSIADLGYSSYYVDEGGILRENPDDWRKKRYRYGTGESWALVKKERPEIMAWLSGRKIAQVGQDYFWFEPVVKASGNFQMDWYLGRYVYCGFTQDIPYRQGHRLDAQDLKFFNSLTQLNRNIVLKNIPWKIKKR